MNATKHFNGLSEAEAERLAVLAEECAEVIVAIGKIQRHGYSSSDPTNLDHPGNRYVLEKEMGDVRQAMIAMCDAGDVRKSMVHHYADEKRKSIKPWLHHQ